MKSESFFAVQGKGAIYENLRSNPDHQNIRDFIEEMWEEYWPHADLDFLAKARNDDFQARYWEMYVGCSLLRQNTQIEPREQRKERWGSPDLGPDFRIIAPHPFWLEATTVWPGTGEDAVPEVEFGVVRDVPDDQLKLRILQSIRDKAKQRLHFRDKGLIDPTDCYVVAVNIGKVSPISDLEPPRIVRAVFGLGLPQVSMNVDSGALSDWRYQPQDHIVKQSSSLVSTRIFLDTEQSDHPDYVGYEGLSAVLSSEMEPFNSCEPWFNHNKYVIGDDYYIVCNPRATNPLPHGFLKCGQEYWLNSAEGLESNPWFKDRAS
ncbi:MAG: hypothetical protein OXB94_13560 [Nitrospira sp.]|nr:hypothetical protein [Nitrospira sp.]